MRRITLLRHTRPEMEAGLCYGRSDLDLAASYAEERDAIRGRRLVFDRVYTSPALRCRRLAEDLSARPVCVDEALQELDFGTWEGRLWRDIPRAESEPWTSDFVHRAPPEGESFIFLARRALAFIAGLSESADVLLVTHSGVMRALRVWDLNLTLEDAFHADLGFGASFELTRHVTDAAAFAVPPERWGRV